MPVGIMRLFVRVEGSTPFSLILDDNLMPEHYVEIALKYYKERWQATRTTPELVLIRRVVFKNNDQLLDFRRKKISSKGFAKTGAAGGKYVQIAAQNPDGSRVEKLYDTTHQPELVRQQMIVTNPPQTSAAHCETEHIIKSATLGRLIMKMTDPTVSPYIADVFWDTYRQFATAREVLEKLIERYEVPPLMRVGGPQRSPLDLQHYAELQLHIKYKVISVLETWVERYYFDFADDELHRRLHQWVREKVDTDGVPARILVLMRTCDRTALRLRKPVPAPGKFNRMPPTAILSHHHPREIANQLTLLTLHYHNHIFPCELVGRQWEGPEAANVPNFIAYRDFINRVSNWVTYTIVSEQNVTTRANNLALLLLVCEELMKLSNWDMLVAVHGGLTDPPVARLSNTWAALPMEQQPLVRKFDELLSVRSTSHTLKAAMSASPRPHFPSIIAHLRELISLDEAPAMADGMINFLRCSHQHNLVRFLLDGKHSRLEFLPNEEVQGAFSFWRPFDDGVLAAESKKIQPT